MPEFASNLTYIPFCLCLDMSGSMSIHLNAINRFIRSFSEAIEKKSVATVCFEVFTVTFGSSNRSESITLRDFENINDFRYSNLEANERTSLGRAVNKAMKELEDRKRYHKSNGNDYKQPVLLIVSDGHDNDDPEVLLNVQAKARQKVLPANGGEGKLTVVPIKFDGANEEVLRGFSPKTEPTMWRGWNEEKFSELIRYINASKERPGQDIDIESLIDKCIGDIFDHMTNDL